MEKVSWNYGCYSIYRSGNPCGIDTKSLSIDPAGVADPFSWSGCWNWRKLQKLICLAADAATAIVAVAIVAVAIVAGAIVTATIVADAVVYGDTFISRISHHN